MILHIYDISPNVIPIKLEHIVPNICHTEPLEDLRQDLGWKMVKSKADVKTWRMC